MRQRRQGHGEVGLGARARVLVALPALVAACGSHATHTAGGQSGTDEPSNPPETCQPARTEPIPTDESLPQLGGTPRDVLSRLQVVANLPGVWFAAWQRSTLAVAATGEVTSSLTSSRRPDGSVCSWSLAISTALRVISDRAVVDAEVPATITVDEERRVLLSAPLPELSAQTWTPSDPMYVRVSSIRSQLGSPPGLVLGARFGFGSEQPLDVAMFRDAGLLGFWTDRPSLAPWLPPEDPVLYTPEPELAESCVGADEQPAFGSSSPGPYQSNAQAQQAIAGVWARCVDSSMSEHVGLQLHPDGRWNQLGLVDGELVPLYGFGREGNLRFFEIDRMGTPGRARIDFLPDGGRAEALDQALVFESPYAEWPGAVYEPTHLPVLPTTEGNYADGERAGEPACRDGERGIVASPEDARQALQGEFKLCTGTLRGGVTSIRFFPGEVELLGSAGATLDRLPFVVDGVQPDSLAIAMGQDGHYNRWWTIDVSRRPLKLRLHESEPSADSTQTAIFSAVP